MSRPSRRGVRIVSLLVGGVGLPLTLAACGSTGVGPGGGGASSQVDLSGDEREAADHLAAELLTGGGPLVGTTTLTDAQAACVADGAVRDVGLDHLQGYDIVAPDLKVNGSLKGVRMSTADADALAAVLADCVDVERLLEREFLHQGGGTPDRAQRRCVREVVDRATVTRILSAGFQGRRSIDEELQQRLTDCALEPTA